MRRPETSSMAHKVVRHSQCDRDIADSANAIPDLVKAVRIFFSSAESDAYSDRHQRLQPISQQI